MLVRHEIPKQNLFRIIVLLLTVWMLMVFIGNYSLQLPAKISAVNSITHSPNGSLLLLNSGAVNADKAEITIIMWFENGDLPPDIQTLQPMPGWVWNSKKLQSASGKTALTISGHHQVNRNEENELYSWYTTIAQHLQKTGGKIYFDERVPQMIDILAYLTRTEAIPAQWALQDNTISIAAYQKKIKTNVMAGQDRVNIQLLSRGQGRAGQTVLAIPVLLQEF